LRFSERAVGRANDVIAEPFLNPIGARNTLGDVRRDPSKGRAYAGCTWSRGSCICQKLNLKFTRADQIFSQADADGNWGTARSGQTGRYRAVHRAVAEIDIEIFDLGRPIRVGFTPF
jgi:hypothetical protein